MKVFKSIIIEDEQVAVENLQVELQELSFIDVVAISDNLEEAERLILYYKPDILFLDIGVRGQPVFDLLKKLESWDLNFGIVFITADPDKYLLEAIESCGLKYKFAYLGKPIHSPKLIGKLSTLRKILLQDSGEVEENSITFNSRSEILRLLYDEILYCETSGNDSIIYLTDETKEVVHENLTSLEAKLPSKNFFRMSGQHVINTQYYRKSYTSDNNRHICILQVGVNKISLPIPPRRWQAFKEKFS